VNELPFWGWFSGVPLLEAATAILAACPAAAVAPTGTKKVEETIMISSRGGSTSLLLDERAETGLGDAPPRERRPRTAEWTRTRRASHLRVRARRSPGGTPFLEPAPAGAAAEAVERRWPRVDGPAIGVIAGAPAAAALMAGFGAAPWLIGITAALLGLALVAMLWRSAA
jgi:hypothetical protein